MKVIVAVALFAFFAVQLCQAAPRPDDDKKEEVPVSAAPVPAAPAVEVKSDTALSADAAAKADVLPVAAPEEKKE